ncbi:5-hydroxytryptamine receptor 3A-like [Salminus brasiliensis]|uniref:5-hydroxytryptamine receptor 3A-like n=1 Tax=Salminus brasiliensis TaxID=930266 RepID=UPI003B833E39
MASTKQMLNFLLAISFLLVLVGSTNLCVSRRCLANELIKKELYSPPQPPECTITVNLTSIQYQTLSVDTKSLRFSSRLKISMAWKDPDLTWTDPQYKFKDLILPASKIWTPILTVDNAVYTDVKPVSKDIIVRSDGTVKYAIVMYITVMCGINLFTYPFVSDSCPVAINGWNQTSCGLNLQYGSIFSRGGDRGEWRTVSVDLRGKGRNYLSVALSINPFNAVVSLVLPSALIMVVDLVSFALPLDGGERNPFKIKLVFSFTMFLLMLCKQLPVSGRCSPLIYFHYCFCLIVLVASVLISMMLTRLAKNGSAWPSRPQRLRGIGIFKTQKDSMSQKLAIDLSDVLTPSEKLPTKEASVQNICSFVENMDKDVRDKTRRQNYANSWDRICFWTYLCLDMIYSIIMIAVTRTEFCKVNNLEF